MQSKIKPMLDFDDFYRFVWNSFINEYDVSFKYREQNEEFIRNITFSSWRKYTTKGNVHEAVYAEMLKIFFVSLFNFRPEVVDCC